MLLRLSYWLGGVLLGLFLTWAFPLPTGADLYPLAFWGAFVLIGLVVEIARGLRALDAAKRIVPPAGARPADGHVDLVPIREARGEPNADDPRFSEFRSLDLDPNDPEGRRSLARVRTPPPLLGKVAIVSVFLGRDGRRWSDAEVARAHAALLRAGTWIERQASRWDAPVNIAVAGTYFVADDDESEDVEMMFYPRTGPFEANALTKALTDLSRAAARLGFRDAEDWLARVNDRIEADVHVWLLHPRRAGRSLAIPLDLTELRGVSLAVCYPRWANFPEPLVGPPSTDAVTVVHELMHLFGATDKYADPLSTFSPEAVSSRDIMRLDERALSRLRVDSLTAWEIGWHRTT